MRRVGVVTTSRADFGIYRPVLRRLASRGDIELRLYVSGGHLEAEQGETVRDIEAEGFAVAARVPMGLRGDAPADIAAAMGTVTRGFADVLDAERPDLLIVLGDRYEMFAATSAAVPFVVPVVHIHGGETTEGAIDDVFRHAITKMAHLHFAATGEAGARIRQMGEEPWRVHVVGAPSLDNLRELEDVPDEALEARIKIAMRPPPLVVTFHPVTMEADATDAHVRTLLAALHRADRPVVFTYPNADTMGAHVRAAIEAFVAEHAEATLVSSLGTRFYFALLRRAAAMVGNTSSGIIESASFKVPVVDIGDRQKGRPRPRNVIHAAPLEADIADAIDRATDPAFRATLDDLENPYGDGHAAERIARVVAEVPLDARLLRKRWPPEVDS